MAVKDLVGLFEGQPTDSSRSSRSSRVPPRRRSQPPATPVGVPPTPARFLRHPLISEQVRSEEKADGLPERGTATFAKGLDATRDSSEVHDYPNTNTTNPAPHSTPSDTPYSSEARSYTHESLYKLEEISSDVTDELLHQEPSASMTRPRDSITVIGSTGAEYEMRSFLNAPNATSEASRSSHTLRPRSPFRAKSDTGSLASTSTAVQSVPSLPRLPDNNLGIHHPIPATTVFARSALPLSLPALDRYISRLPPSALPSLPPRGKGKDKYYSMFPPMDRLEATGRTIEDLENNSVVASWWNNRNSILSSLVNGALGVTVRNFVVNLLSNGSSETGIKCSCAFLQPTWTI